jgi:hypothetical protein
MDMKANRWKIGMSLVEVMIVVVILGVVLAGIFMFFVSGTEQFHFARRQNELDMSGRMALDRITNSLIWAGYMPHGGWEDDEWHPMQTADPDTVRFYADRYPRFKVLTDREYINIFRGIDGAIHIENDSGVVWTEGHNITDLYFSYLDGDGNDLGFPLASDSLRDLIRQIRVDLELSEEYGDHVYQSVMHTTITPRNLGIDHGFNPLFYPPEPLRGIIAFNVFGSDTIPNPTQDEILMIEKLTDWGYTVTQFTDAMASGFDYEDIDLIILRHRTDGISLPAGDIYMASNGQDSIPVITMNPHDAEDYFGLGTAIASHEDSLMYGLMPWHDVLKNVFPAGSPDSVAIYQPGLGGEQTYLDYSNGLDSLLIDRAAGYGQSGVCCNTYSTPGRRRVHYGAWDASCYNDKGWQLFRNVVRWGAGTPPGGSGGTILMEEGFEDPGSTPAEITIWEDDITPQVGQTMVPIYEEHFDNGTTTLTWDLSPLGGGRTFVRGSSEPDDPNCLQMDRSGAGAITRNVGYLTVDLSAYNENLDDLVLQYRANTSSEGFLDAADDVFLTELSGGSTVQVLSEDFENLALGHGDIEFWGDLYGQYRVHEPTGWGGDGKFVTFDTRSPGNYAHNRMMVEVDLSSVLPGSDIQVDYRFHDHDDDSDAGSDGDFLGYNDTGLITGAVEGVHDLDPASYDDDSWHDRSATWSFGTLPSTLYVLFGQYGNQTAVDFDEDGGISLDNITVSAIQPPDTTYDAIGGLSATNSDWQTFEVDLDQEALVYGHSFDSDFSICFSQEGGTSFGSGSGIRWDDIIIGEMVDTLWVEGWSHAPLSGGVDDWTPADVGGGHGHAWTTWANNAGLYSDNSHCYLQSPEVFIPDLDWTSPPTLRFYHRYVTQPDDDGGYVQISTGGGPWTTLDSLDYTGISSSAYPGGAGIPLFTGNQPAWEQVELDLAAYEGTTVQFRFVFGSDGSGTDMGWQLDDFSITGEASGYYVESVQFESDGAAALAWDSFDMYLGYTNDGYFTGDGEMDVSAMTKVVEDGTLEVNGSGWQDIQLEKAFILLPDKNLTVKVELHNSAIGGGNDWLTASVTAPGYRCRQEGSSSGDPTYLYRYEFRPNIRVQTNRGTLSPVPGMAVDPYVPMSDMYDYNDFEAIYTAEELGTSGGGAGWNTGGGENDWEFGYPLFTPDIDPALDPANENSIAGNDLTVNGLYEYNANNWLRSPAFYMPDTLTSFDSVKVNYFHCIRTAALDNGAVQLGFSDDGSVPGPTDWIMIADYNGIETAYWENVSHDVASEFNSAYAAGDRYYFLRFTLYTGGSGGLRGGWNLDNVSVTGHFE